MLFNIYAVVCGLLSFCIGSVGIAYFIHKEVHAHNDKPMYFLAGLLMLLNLMATMLAWGFLPIAIIITVAMIPVIMLSRLFGKFSGKSLKQKIKEML